MKNLFYQFPFEDFEIHPVLKIQRLDTNPNYFNVVLLEKEGKDVMVDFSDYEIKEGASYKIHDVENRNKIIKSGKISSEITVQFPMNLSDFEKPLHNTIATKSANNFGVFRIEFDKQKEKKIQLVLE